MRGAARAARARSGGRRGACGDTPVRLLRCVQVGDVIESIDGCDVRPLLDPAREREREREREGGGPSFPARADLRAARPCPARWARSRSRALRSYSAATRGARRCWTCAPPPPSLLLPLPVSLLYTHSLPRYQVTRSLAAGGTRGATRVRVGITRRAGSEDLVFPCPDDQMALVAPPSPPSPPPPPPPRSPRGHGREVGAGGDGAAPGGAGAGGAGGQCGVGLGFSYDPAHGGLCVRAVAPGVATAFAEGDRLVEVRTNLGTNLPPARVHKASARRRCAKPPHDACGVAVRRCGRVSRALGRGAGGRGARGHQRDGGGVAAVGRAGEHGSPQGSSRGRHERRGDAARRDARAAPDGARQQRAGHGRRRAHLWRGRGAPPPPPYCCPLPVSLLYTHSLPPYQVLAHHAPSACFAVKRTVPGGAAEAAGLRAGDVVVAIGGTPLRDFPKERLPSLLLGPEGSEVVVAFLRPGEQRRAEVSLIRSVDAAKAQVRAPAPPRCRGREGRRNRNLARSAQRTPAPGDRLHSARLPPALTARAVDRCRSAPRACDSCSTPRARAAPRSRRSSSRPRCARRPSTRSARARSACAPARLRPTSRRSRCVGLSAPLPPRLLLLLLLLLFLFLLLLLPDRSPLV